MCSLLFHLSVALSLCTQKGVASGLAAKERERVDHYRETTKAAQVIQQALRKYLQRKQHRETVEQQAQAQKVSEWMRVWVGW